MKTKHALGIALSLVISAAADRHVSAADPIIIASTGGAYDRALKEAWLDPFTAETGIPVTIVSATNAEMRAKA